jgi:transposase-like protein
MTCPNCKSENVHQRQGALYYECWTCDYAWVPTHTIEREDSR